MNCSNSFELTADDKTEKIDRIQQFQEIGNVSIPKGKTTILPNLSTNIPNARSCIEVKYDRYDKKICSDDLIGDSKIDHDFAEDVVATVTCDCKDDSFEFTKEKGCVPIESFETAKDENSKVRKHVDGTNLTLEKINLEYDLSQKKVETLTLQLNEAIKDLEQKKQAKVQASADFVAANERLKLTELKQQHKKHTIVIFTLVLLIITFFGVLLYRKKDQILKILTQKKGK